MPVGCFALAVATISIATEHAEPPTTYGSVSTFAYVADLAATLTLLTAGAASALFRPRGSVAALATGVGVTWLASDWVGWSLGWPVARSVAMLIAPLTVPLLFHLIAAYPTGKLSSSRDRLLTVTAYAAVGTASLVHAAVYDPFRQVDCWTNCTTNVFLVQSRPGMAEWSTSTSLVLTIATAAAAALVGARRLAAATSVVRGATWFVVIPAVAAELAFASYAVLLLTGPSEDPQRSSYRWHFLVRATLLVCLGLGILWGVFRARRTEWALHRLVDDLGGSTRPGSLRDVLALQLGDDDLTVAYWLPSNGTFVDADGVPTDPVPAWNQASTRIMRGGETLAVVVHDESLTGQREIGAAARLAVDNERRQAEILAQLREVRESQVRIVAAADATRQALERDIHDGTQHRLLAAFYELRLARERDS